MRQLNRSGFTLIELMVVVTVLVIVLGGIYQAIASMQRSAGSVVQRMDVQQNTRSVALYLTYMLRELSSGDGDIAVAQPQTLEIRSMRWAGVLCTTPLAVPGGVSITLRDDLQFGLRAPDQATDSLMLFWEGDPGDRDDDSWLAGGVEATAAGVCDDASAGTQLTIQIDAASGGNGAALAGVTVGAPARGFQQEEFSLYQSGSDYWLGSRAADRGGTWTAVNPLIGPLTSDGLAFEYFTSAGVSPAPLNAIASIGLTVRGRSLSPVSGGTGYLQDSIITRIALRNNPRF